MLTLITCHPYTKNYQRYVVYCSRDTEELLSDQEIPYEGEAYTSSENEIQLEKQINRDIMIFAVLLVLLVLFIKKGQRGGQTPLQGSYVRTYNFFCCMCFFLCKSNISVTRGMLFLLIMRYYTYYCIKMRIAFCLISC